MRQEWHLVARNVMVLTPIEQLGYVPDLLFYSIHYHRLGCNWVSGEYLASKTWGGRGRGGLHVKEYVKRYYSLIICALLVTSLRIKSIEILFLFLNLARRNCTVFRKIFSIAIGLIAICSLCVHMFGYHWLPTMKNVNSTLSYIIYMFGDIFQNLLNTLLWVAYFYCENIGKKFPNWEFWKILMRGDSVFAGTDFLRVTQIPWGKITLFAEERVQYYGIRETWWVLDPGSILITYY